MNYSTYYNSFKKVRILIKYNNIFIHLTFNKYATAIYTCEISSG